MNRRAPRKDRRDSTRGPRFPLRCLFNPQRPRGRYKMNGSGVIENQWERVNAFEICEGEAKGGLIAMYNSDEFDRETTIQYLRERGYTEFLASGKVNPKTKELHFRDPADAQACNAWLAAIDDTEFCRHFGCYVAFTPSGENLGEIKIYCFQDVRNA